MAMMENRVCTECGAPLPNGVSDVFCPACALHAALDVGKQPGEGTVRRWFRQLTGKEADNKSGEKGFAYDENQERQSPVMATAAPTPGEVIGDYEIIEQIGGNMGLVYKARHRLLDKVVALKLVPTDRMADSARLARFQREMRVMGQLEHPNLVPAADARSVGEWHLVAMELIDGVDLQQLVRAAGPMSVATACEVARQAALGLQYAHQNGLIHRDIKPSNLMLTRSGTVKVIDMGLALTREDSTANLTQTGLMLGTMSYCAPEQFRDAAHVDIRADIYSLGCTLYHLLAGRAPYWQRQTVAEVVEAHLHEPFPSLTQARPDAPKDLGAVLARMTAKDRNARFSAPREVVEALEPFAHGADLKSLVPAVTQPSPPRRLTADKPPFAGEQVRRRTKSLWPRLTALLVLPLAIAGAFVAFNRPTRQTMVPGTNRVAAIPAANLGAAAPAFTAPVEEPVVVLMDTMAPTGIYDLDNRAKGVSNAKEVSKALVEMDVLPASSMRSVSLFAGWDSEAYVVNLRPHLVAIHRSSFHHSYNAVFEFGSTNLFRNPAEDPKWRMLYNEVGDDRLLTLLAYIAIKVPQTQFLVYSRGTDTNWLKDNFRVEWVKKAGARFNELEGRITTMVIPNRYNGSFRQPETRALLASNVTRILRLPPKNN